MSARFLRASRDRPLATNAARGSGRWRRPEGLGEACSARGRHDPAGNVQDGRALAPRRVSRPPLGP
eukprot:12492093-Alexandrium_andersonii.AAC.1